MSDTPIYDRLLELSRRGKLLAEPRDFQGRPLRNTKTAAGAVNIIAKRRDLAAGGYGSDVYRGFVAEGIATAVLWNA